MNCPQCETSSVRRQQYEGIAVDRCDSCGGFWLRDEELRLVLETVDLDATMISEEDRAMALGRGELDYGWGGQIACPDCASELEEFRFLVSTRIYVDYCPANHGMWIEAGKLERMQLVLSEEFGQRIPVQLLERSIAAAPPAVGEETQLSQLAP